MSNQTQESPQEGKIEFGGKYIISFDDDRMSAAEKEQVKRELEDLLNHPDRHFAVFEYGKFQLTKIPEGKEEE